MFPYVEPDCEEYNDDDLDYWLSHLYGVDNDQ